MRRRAVAQPDAGWVGKSDFRSSCGSGGLPCSDFTPTRFELYYPDCRSDKRENRTSVLSDSDFFQRLKREKAMGIAEVLEVFVLPWLNVRIFGLLTSDLVGL